MSLNSSYRVLAHDVLDAHNARMVARVTAAGFTEELQKLDRALAKQKLGIVKGSTVIARHEQHYKVVSFSIVPLNGSIESTTLNKARMIALSSNGQDNMFMDAEDQVWEEIDGRLVRKTGFENPQTLEKACAKFTAQASVADRNLAIAAAKNAVGDIVGGNYCRFVDGSVMGDGYIVACDEESGTALVLPRPDNLSNPYPAKQVPYFNIVEAFDWEDVVEQPPVEPEDEVVTAASISLDAALDYYRKIYGYNADFWRGWEQLMRQKLVY